MGLKLLPAAKALLAERGYDPVLGARPLRRTIQRAIEDMLSEKILFGELGPGQIVTVNVEDTGPEAQFTFEGVPKPGEVPDTPPAEIASESKAAHVAGSPLNGSPKRVSGGRYPSS
jgi:ATP-dependent Clp protease ATP-binding subunit ClpC